MKLISHRGNYNGVYPDRENKPSYIDTTLSMGYDVEVDIRYINGEFYLGHDTPDTLISRKWIINRKDNIWFHCKDLSSAQELSKMDDDIKYFCHSNDSYVLTSTNHIWVHDLDLELDNKCIIPLLDVNSIEKYDNRPVYAICTDYIDVLKKNINKKICIFYGNCQVIYNVYDVLNSIPEFRYQYKSIRYVNHDRDQTKELSNINTTHLKNCDLFIYQPLGINHGVFSTENIKKFLKDECVKISFPYVYNSSFYTTYWEGASSRWTIGTLVNCGWRNIMKLILEEYKIDEILSLYDEDKIDFYFEERMNICMKSLKEKEKDCDIKVTDFILNNFKDKRLFITQNHLTHYFNKWISNRILEILNMSLLPDEYSNDVSVEANCVYDSYNKKYYDFSYDIKSITDNNSTRYKIVEFYNFFKNKKSNFNVKDIVPYIIINDPENFINSPYA